MLQKSGRLVLWEAMFILELHSAETQVKTGNCGRTSKSGQVAQRTAGIIKILRQDSGFDVGVGYILFNN